MDLLKMCSLLKMGKFHCHVSLPECNFPRPFVDPFVANPLTFTTRCNKWEGASTYPARCVTENRQVDMSWESKDIHPPNAKRQWWLVMPLTSPAVCSGGGCGHYVGVGPLDSNDNSSLFLPWIQVWKKCPHLSPSAATNHPEKRDWLKSGPWTCLGKWRLIIKQYRGNQWFKQGDPWDVHDPWRCTSLNFNLFSRVMFSTPTLDGRNPKQPPGNDGINYQPQLVQDFGH